MKKMLAGFITALLSMTIIQTVSAKTLFLAHFNGDAWIGNGGLRADYTAAGSGIPTITTGVSRATGRFGTGAHFPSNTSANVSLGFDSAGIFNTDQGTVDFWWTPDFDLSAIGGGFIPILLDVYNSSNGHSFMAIALNRDGGGVYMYIYSQDVTLPDQNKSYMPTPLATAGTPIHIAVTWNHTNGVSLFVNGLLIKGAPTAATWSNIVVSKVYPGNGGPFFAASFESCGVIDEFRITDQVEYTNNFTPLTAEYTNPPAPVSSNLLFLCHYDGSTPHGGLDADYATGSRIATITTGVSRATGRFGTGAHFPSNTSANVSLGFDSAGIFNTDQGTVDFWWTPDFDLSAIDGSGFIPILLDVYNATNGHSFMAIALNHDGGGVYMYIYSQDVTLPDQDKSYMPTPLATAGTPIHIAVTWNHTSGVSSFVNGLLIKGAPAAATWSNIVVSKVYPGNGGTQFAASFESCGVIDEFRITGNVEYDNNGFTPPLNPYPVPPPAGIVFRFH